MAKKEVAKKEVAKTDIKDLKEALDFGFAFFDALKASKEDGIGINDLNNLMIVVPKLGPAFDGASTIPAEVKDIDKEELAELIAFTITQAGRLIDEKEAIVKIEKTLMAVAAIFDAVKAWK